MSSFWTETSKGKKASQRRVDQKKMLFKIYFSKKVRKEKSRKM